MKTDMFPNTEVVPGNGHEISTGIPQWANKLNNNAVAGTLLQPNGPISLDLPETDDDGNSLFV